jgi:hypothetical protein
MPCPHGKGPKFLHVRKYLRWVNGELQKVESHARGYTYPLHSWVSELQLDFGF